MEPGSSLSCSQESATGLCPEPDESSSHHSSYSSMIHFNIILSYIPTSHFPTNTLCTSPPPRICYMLCPFHPPWLDDCNYIWQGVQIMQLLTVQFSPASYYFTPLGSKILSSTPCSQTPAVYVILLMSEAKFHTHTNYRQNYNFVFCFNLVFWVEWQQPLPKFNLL
jgi:hypothetical protein